MPKHAPLLSPEHRTYAAERYLADVPPRELAAELQARFGISVAVPALRQWVTRSGLAKRRKALDAKTCALVSGSKVNALARAKASEPGKHLERWVEKTVAVADRALDLASAATKPRDLASSMAAANTAIRLYRLCAGIDGPESSGRPTFNFDFANKVYPRVTVTPEGKVQVDVTAAAPEPPQA